MTNISAIASGSELSRRSIRLYRIFNTDGSMPCGVGGSWFGNRPRLVLRPGAGWSVKAGAASSERMRPVVQQLQVSVASPVEGQATLYEDQGRVEDKQTCLGGLHNRVSAKLSCGLHPAASELQLRSAVTQISPGKAYL